MPDFLASKIRKQQNTRSQGVKFGKSRMKKTIAEMIVEQKKSIRDTATKERAELRTLEALAKVLPEDCKPDRIFVNRLYGSVADLAFGDSFVPYGAEDTRCTMADVARLLDMFPPVKVWNIRSGCLAMRPDWDVKDKEITGKDAEANDQWGVMLDVEPGINSGGASQKVEWYTEKNGLRFGVTCILKPEHYPATVEIRAKRAFGRGPITRIEDTMIQPRGSFWLDQRAKWAPGSNQYAHKFTCYWISIDDSQGAGKAWLEQICGENFPPKSGHFQSRVGYQPKTGQKCHCKPGMERDNCPSCEGTGWVIDFAAIRAKSSKK